MDAEEDIRRETSDYEQSKAPLPGDAVKPARTLKDVVDVPPSVPFSAGIGSVRPDRVSVYSTEMRVILEIEAGEPTANGRVYTVDALHKLVGDMQDIIRYGRLPVRASNAGDAAIIGTVKALAFDGKNLHVSYTLLPGEPIVERVTPVFEGVASLADGSVEVANLLSFVPFYPDPSDEIEKAAREGKPLTDKMIRDSATKLHLGKDSTGKHKVHLCCGTCVHRDEKVTSVGNDDVGYACEVFTDKLVYKHQGTDCDRWSPLTPAQYDELARAEAEKIVEAAEKDRLDEEEKIVEDLENQLDPVTTGGRQSDPDCFKCKGTGRWPLNKPAEDRVDCDCYERPHKIERRRERLAGRMTCIKATDPDTFKPSWGLWADGIEILRLDPEALQDLTSEYGDAAFPLELRGIIHWLEQLAKKREKSPAETFTGDAALAKGVVNARAKDGVEKVVTSE